MSVEPINPAGLCRPSGFSHAVRASGTTTVHLAGQTALDRRGHVLGSTIVEQFEQAVGNLLTALRAAGGTPAHLASLTIYLVDVDDYKAHAGEIGAAWRRVVGDRFPAMAVVGFTRLWDPDALFEVQGTAELPTASGHRPAGARENPAAG